MYEHQGLEYISYLLLYGSAMMLAAVAGCYLLLRRGNVFSPTLNTSLVLRRWTAAFLWAIVLSHVWWTVFGVSWLADDRALRNVVCELLDFATLLPLLMVVLLRMLQDRRRPLWPVFTVVAVAVLTVLVAFFIVHWERWEWLLRFYDFLLAITFVVYYVREVIRYDRWLRDNFANLEHKELWQSLVLLACILTAFVAYATNYGGIVTEFLTQVFTILLIVFLLWRVETLQELSFTAEPDQEEPDKALGGERALLEEVQDPLPQKERQGGGSSEAIEAIGVLLAKSCEGPMLYLQDDLTLAQLAMAVGTNRTYLSAWFAQQGYTYNTYINRLRIEHFCRLYREAIRQSRSVTAQVLAEECGFHSYSTFSANFKRLKGETVTAWMACESSACSINHESNA